MKLNDRINIIVTESGGTKDNEPLVWESYAGNSAGVVEDKARKLAYSGEYGKVYVGSIPSNCLNEVTVHGGAVRNSAGVRFKAKTVVDTEKQKHAIDEYFNNLARDQRERLATPKGGKIKYPLEPSTEEIELSDVAIERLAGDILDDFLCADELLSALNAKNHAKEVAHAEKVEKYKRELLNSREARFYARFREFGATHKEAAKLAWGES